MESSLRSSQRIPGAGKFEEKCESSQWPLAALFGICIARLWLVPLPSSFRVDELETVFVAAHPRHPSLGSAREAFESIYYYLPRAAHALTGSSEISYRLPSMLAMAIALGLIARLAARLIHPRAGWFAVFTCLLLRGIDYHAIDARPYALGIMVSAASVFLLVRWLDSARWSDAALFAVAAALVWRVHLVYWPFYILMAIYVLSRVISGETRVRWPQWAAAAALIALALVPPAMNALTLARGAAAHVIAPPPTLRVFLHELHWNVPLLCGVVFWFFAKWRGWTGSARKIVWPDLVFIGAWWLCQPVVICLYAWVSGNSLYVDRYLSIMLPGLALTATAAAAWWMPADKWRFAAAGMALAALAFQGHWGTLVYRHDVSDWRSAAAEANRFAQESTPVVVVSPFIEARPPAWSADYALPGFLYSHLERYPIHGKLYFFPFEDKDGVRYARELARGSFNGTAGFEIYGQTGQVRFWRQWFATRPEFAGWSNLVRDFGDVGVAEFQRNE